MLKYATFLERKQVRISMKFVPESVYLDGQRLRRCSITKEFIWTPQAEEL